MSETKQADDLTPEEISDIDEFYANDEDKISFKNSDEFVTWLNE